MNLLFEAARAMQDFAAQRGWKFCIIGGLAVIRWGEPRATQDVDVTLLTGFGREQAYITEILAHFGARIADAEEFALAKRVLLIKAPNGIPIDVALGGIAYEEKIVERATPFAFLPECDLNTCSAEDLVVLKTFAARPRDWIDVEGVVIRCGAQLDWDYIFEQLSPLCELKESPELVGRLREIRRNYSV